MTSVRRAMGLDIGGSGVKGAVVDVGRGELIGDRVRIATPRPATPDAVLETAAEIRRRLGYTGRVGCGFPGSFRAGRVHRAPNLEASWGGYDLAAGLRRHLGCDTVAIGNDADVAGLAEIRLGAGRGEQGTVVVVTLGTGIGTAVFRDGVLLPGTELGHVELDGEPAEHRASYGARRREGLSWPEWAGRVDRYLAHVEYLLAVDLFILGGGASKKGDRFLPYFERVACRVELAAMGNLAGIVGAALLATEA